MNTHMYAAPKTILVALKNNSCACCKNSDSLTLCGQNSILLVSLASNKVLR